MLSMTEKIPFNHPNLFMDEAISFVKNSLNLGAISGDGPNTEFCVRWFQKRFGYERVLLTPSCTSALEMTALLLELMPGDEVIVPSFTFVSTANAFALRGVELRFADSGSDNPNVCVNSILSLITDRTKAIVVVHYAGVPLDLRPLLATKIPIVEDCAHAIGAVDPFTFRPIGLAGVMSTFSFHQTKNIPIGEGGMLVVNEDKLWEKAQIIREKGTNRTRFLEKRDTFYTWHSLGSSYLLSDIDAAFLRASLNHFDEIQNKRTEIWKIYDQELLPASVYEKPAMEISLSNAHMYYLKFQNDELQKHFCKYMKENNVVVATHYIPLEQSPFIKDAKCYQGSLCPNSQEWYQTLVRLPIFFDLTKEKQLLICKLINGFAIQQGYVLQKVTLQQYNDILAIRNANREAFCCSDIVDFETHQKFMESNLETYRVAIHDFKVVGFVGHVKGDFRIACDKSFQGSGLAQFMYSAFLDEFPSITVQVKKDNYRSLAFFKKLGLEPQMNATPEAGKDTEVWDVYLQGSGQTQISKSLLFKCNSNHMSRIGIDMENQILMNMLCKI